MFGGWPCGCHCWGGGPCGGPCGWALRRALPLLRRLALWLALPRLALGLALRRLGRRVVGHVALPGVRVVYRKMTLEAAGLFGYRRRATAADSPVDQAAIGANRAFATRARSPGASSSCSPRLPAETNSESNRSAEASTTTGNRARCAIGLIPPTT